MKLPSVLIEQLIFLCAVIQSPTNDISGLRNLSASDQKRMALRSSKETFRIAKRAMNQFGCKVIILARPRRGDSVELEKLNRMSNDHLCKLIVCEEEPRLTYGSNESLMSFSDDDLFGRRFSTARYDGFHLRGKHGADAYTNMVIQAIQKAQNLPVVIQNKPQSCATESSSKWAEIVNQIISVTTHFTCSSNLLYTAIDLLAFYENRVFEDVCLLALAVIQISADWDGAPVSLKRTLNYMKLDSGSEKDVQAIQTRISTELHIKVFKCIKKRPRSNQQCYLHL